METTTHNAAHQAAQAKPCQKCRDNFPLPEPMDHFDRQVVATPTIHGIAPEMLQLVLEAFDDTESLRTVLRAYSAVEGLIGYADHPHATVCGDELSELLQVLNEAMAARVAAVATKMDAVHAVLRNHPGAACHLAWEAGDQVSDLKFACTAYAAVQHLIAFADKETARATSAALQVLGEAMAARAQAMDDKMTALHTELTRCAAQGGAA